MAASARWSCMTRRRAWRSGASRWPGTRRRCGWCNALSSKAPGSPAGRTTGRTAATQRKRKRPPSAPPPPLAPRAPRVPCAKPRSPPTATPARPAPAPSPRPPPPGCCCASCPFPRPTPPDSAACPACARAQPAPTSTWVLLRLWRFARPYRRQLAAGFALTLASTAATLVPPYLSIPMMGDILIPFQNGRQIAPGPVVLYLGALLLSALAAWGLSWARTYILALVSERIGADLRTSTYEHLLRLSLDYFGGKRTGDLMARIGSETDRINVFLSLHALDFVTDL